MMRSAPRVPPELSPNSIAHGVFPSSGAFLGAVHGHDIPVRVYQFEGDICDGVGERLIASGTARFHSSDKQHIDGRVIQNAGCVASWISSAVDRLCSR